MLIWHTCQRASLRRGAQMEWRNAGREQLVPLAPHSPCPRSAASRCGEGLAQALPRQMAPRPPPRSTPPCAPQTQAMHPPPPAAPERFERVRLASACASAASRRLPALQGRREACGWRLCGNGPIAVQRSWGRRGGGAGNGSGLSQMEKAPTETLGFRFRVPIGFARPAKNRTAFFRCLTS